MSQEGDRIAKVRLPRRLRGDEGRAQLWVIPIVLLWYMVSFAGIILNKSLLSPRNGLGHVEPTTLALVQTLSTVICGFLAKLREQKRKSKAGFEDVTRCRRDICKLLGLGLLRFAVMVLGLISLRYVAASFTETVKASSPLVTVIAAYFLLGEGTDPLIMFSLAFVVGGLMVASAHEVSFTLIGFAAALLTNVVECVQNVVCKKLLEPQKSGGAPYTPGQLQYFTAAASLFFQLPLFFIAYQSGNLHLPAEATTTTLLLSAGIIYYFQSALVFQIMSHYSPVTVSVLNTAKRAMIIGLSTIYFGNIVTRTAQFGTAVTLFGSAFYSYLKSHPNRKQAVSKTKVDDDSDLSSGSSSRVTSKAIRSDPNLWPDTRRHPRCRFCGAGRSRSLPLYGCAAFVTLQAAVSTLQQSNCDSFERTKERGAPSAWVDLRGVFATERAWSQPEIAFVGHRFATVHRGGLSRGSRRIETSDESSKQTMRTVSECGEWSLPR
eukprot:TRINITY_DN16294_c0_g1_i1.p1 TRINITY_DN16294_c0_g1~~TRINITY_DN16294_c0_g1_i1.p1  ORF type:complete len:491 (-),score=47.27 TRINITY_DN16294_c0_g1_i1:147-1619(-)